VFLAVRLPRPSTPQLNIDTTQTTAPGCRRRFHAAAQLYVFRDLHEGAGIVAGGLFYCAEGSIRTPPALAGQPGRGTTSSLVSTTNSWASQGIIDLVRTVARRFIYLAHRQHGQDRRDGCAENLLQQLCAGRRGS
jgi:hypothetical protein